MIEPLAMKHPGMIPASADAMRDVMRGFAVGVTAVTTLDSGQPAGMTATAFTSVSLEPPIVLCCLNASSRTAAAVIATGSFAVNILALEQKDLAATFAQRLDDKFAGVAWEPGPLGLPILTDAVASVACTVREVTEAGTHRIVLGDVIACARGDGQPLLYLEGSYGHFTKQA
jgi:flavin reductase (DIM6/NTAB) family NADH-FMN oxidoreductase RutF